MRAQAGQLADRLRNSYWFVPTLMSVGAILLAFLTLWADASYKLNAGGAGWWGRLLFTGGSQGAQNVLKTVASSSMTVAGVVFSITMVALTLASQQYGTRLLANFMRDRGNQITLGTFLATFLYSLVVLRTLNFGSQASVPHLSVTVSLVLAIAGVSVLIYFVHHVAATIQAPNLAKMIGREFRDVLDRAYTQDLDVQSTAVPELDTGSAAAVPARKRGYLQIVDYDGLLDLATEHDLEIRIEHRPGHFLVPSTVLAHAWPAERVDDQLARRITHHITAGSRRTPQQDVEFPARQLTEMAVRGLSPGINDVVTATICIDHLSDALCEAAGRSLARRSARDDDGRVRVWSADPMTFADLVGSFDGIRESADYHVEVYRHTLRALERVARCVQQPERLHDLATQARLFLEAAERDVAAEADKETIRRAYDDVVAAVSRSS